MRTRSMDSSGFIVQYTGRYTIKYRDNDRLAKITTGIGIPTDPVYRGTLSPWILADGTTQAMTDAERSRVLDNIGQGLAFMGVQVKWYDGPPPPWLRARP